MKQRKNRTILFLPRLYQITKQLKSPKPKPKQLTTSNLNIITNNYKDPYLFTVQTTQTQTPNEQPNKHTNIFLTTPKTERSIKHSRNSNSLQPKRKTLKTIHLTNFYSRILKTKSEVTSENESKNCYVSPTKTERTAYTNNLSNHKKALSITNYEPLQISHNNISQMNFIKPLKTKTARQTMIEFIHQQFKKLDEQFKEAEKTSMHKIETSPILNIKQKQRFRKNRNIYNKFYTVTPLRYAQNLSLMHHRVHSFNK